MVFDVNMFALFLAVDDGTGVVSCHVNKAAQLLKSGELDLVRVAAEKQPEIQVGLILIIWFAYFS